MTSHVHLLIMYELVHASGSKRCPHSIYYRAARIDIADQLRFALTCVRSIFQKYYLRLLQGIEHRFRMSWGLHGLPDHYCLESVTLASVTSLINKTYHEIGHAGPSVSFEIIALSIITPSSCYSGLE